MVCNDIFSSLDIVTRCLQKSIAVIGASEKKRNETNRTETKQMNEQINEMHVTLF